MTAPRETGGEVVWENPDPKRLKVAPHTMDDRALASLVEIFAEDHPYVGVQMGMWEAASRLRRYAATPRPVEVTEARPEAFTDEVTGWTTHDSTLSVRYHGASADLLTLFIEESPLPTNGGPARRTTVKRSALLAALRAQPARDDGPFFEDAEAVARRYVAGEVISVNDAMPMARALLDYSRRLRAQPAGGTPTFTEQEAMWEASGRNPLRFAQMLLAYPAPVADAGGTP